MPLGTSQEKNGLFLSVEEKNEPELQKCLLKFLLHLWRIYVNGL